MRKIIFLAGVVTGAATLFGGVWVYDWYDTRRAWSDTRKAWR